MNRTSVERIRGLIGEVIPSGGTAADTMFTVANIEDLLELGTASNADYAVQAAAYHGWMEKMANYANLVTVNEGNAARELTELHRQAKRMVDQYVAYIPTPGRGRARLGTIKREDTY